jgi:hypothetical protein
MSQQEKFTLYGVKAYIRKSKKGNVNFVESKLLSSSEPLHFHTYVVAVLKYVNSCDVLV